MAEPHDDAPWQALLSREHPAGRRGGFVQPDRGAFSRDRDPLASAATEREAEQPHPAAAHAPKIQTATAETPARHHPPSRPGTVLSDTQIAGIETRLNQTPDQERLWPAVEAALREVSYAKTAANTATQAPARAALDGGRLAYIDPNGADVQQLKMAALPLIMRLNDDQRREVRSLAHVMGLDGVANSF